MSSRVGGQLPSFTPPSASARVARMRPYHSPISLSKRSAFSRCICHACASRALRSSRERSPTPINTALTSSASSASSMPRSCSAEIFDLRRSPKTRSCASICGRAASSLSLRCLRCTVASPSGGGAPAAPPPPPPPPPPLPPTLRRPAAALADPSSRLPTSPASLLYLRAALAPPPLSLPPAPSLGSCTLRLAATPPPPPPPSGSCTERRLELLKSDSAAPSSCR